MKDNRAVGTISVTLEFFASEELLNRVKASEDFAASLFEGGPESPEAKGDMKNLADEVQDLLIKAAAENFIKFTHIASSRFPERMIEAIRGKGALAKISKSTQKRVKAIEKSEEMPAVKNKGGRPKGSKNEAPKK